MRRIIIGVAGLLLNISAPAGPNDRRFPDACIVFASTERTTCAGSLDVSGNLACGHPESDQMTEVSWRFLYSAAAGDVYRVSRRARAKETPPLTAEPLETKEVIYSGERLIVFTADFIVTFQPESFREQARE